MKINSCKSNAREKVSDEDLKKAKESGVVQQKPNGSWGIISIQKGEWWTPDYDSEESAKAALKAYHAGRFHNSNTLVEDLYAKVWDEDKPYSEVWDGDFKITYKVSDVGNKSLLEWSSSNKEDSVEWETHHSKEDEIKEIRNALPFELLLNTRGRNSEVGSLWMEALKLCKQYSPDATDAELDKIVDFGFRLAAKPQDFIDTLKEKLAERKVNARHGDSEFPDHGVVYIARPKSDKSEAPVGQSKFDKLGFIASNPNKLSRFLESKGYVLMQESDYLESETRMLATIILYFDEFPNLTWFDKGMQDSYFAATQDRRGRVFNGRHKMWNFPDKGCVAILRPYADKSNVEAGMGQSDHILIYDLPNMDDFQDRRLSLMYQSEPLNSERAILDRITKFVEKNKALIWEDDEQHKAYAAAMQDLYNRNVNSESEMAAVVLMNPDGTHEVVSIQDESDWDRVDSYVKDDKCKVIKKCKSTKEADEYIESKKLKRAYQDNSRQVNTDAATLLQTFKKEVQGTPYTATYDSEWEEISLVSNGSIFIIQNQPDGFILMDENEEVILETKDTEKLLAEVRKCIRGQRSRNARDPQKEYAFLMLSYDTPELIKKLQQDIPESELYLGNENDKERYGIEDEYHISLLPCLSNNTHLDMLIPKLPELSTLGANLVNISVFECDDYDVLKADVAYDSPIAALHDELVKEFKTHSEYEYHPHMTIAYLKKGEAAKYLVDFESPIYVVPNDYKYSFWSKGEMKVVDFS